jgi:hypothetical protein
MAEAILLVSYALLLLSSKCHTQQRDLQHSSLFHTTSISVSSLDTF